MKKFVLALFLLFISQSILAQRDNYLLDFKGESVVFSNNFFLRENEKDRVSDKIESPFLENKINIYGEVLEIRYFENFPQYIGFSGIDEFDSKINFKNINQLEFQIVKNNQIIVPWSLIASNEKKTEVFSPIKNLPTVKSTFYDLFKTKLKNGDVVKFYLRKKNSKEAVYYTFTKKYDDEVPFSAISFDNNSDISLENFINQLQNFRSKNLQKDLFTDLPSSYFSISNNHPTKVGENVKRILFFRHRKNVTSKNMLEYRLITNGKNGDGKWNLADDYIILKDFKKGNDYQLQVRYTGSKKYIVFNYFTDKYWYQDLWVQVLGISLLIVLILVSIYIIKIRNNKKKIEWQRLKMQSLSTQLNPHFVFNSLNSIQGLVNNGELEKTNIYLSDFAKLMRNIVDFGQKETITLGQDINALKNYISLENLRFPFIFEMIIDEKLDVDNLDVIPLLAQPILENAVKHGVSRLKENGKIKMKISKNEDNLVYEIEDNGNGFDYQKEFKGIGIKLTKEKINLFNQTSNLIKINLSFVKTEHGTKVILTYKNLLKYD